MIRSLHHEHAGIRDWIVKHVPMADSLIGYELFVALSELVIDAGPIDQQLLCQRMHFPQAQVLEALARYEKEGMLALPAGEGVASPRRQPTQALINLIAHYFSSLEHAFIPRDTLRSHQLHLAVADPARRRLVTELYDRFYDIGWLYVYQFGAMCFAMSTLVKRLAERLGHTARIECVNLEIHHPQGVYGVGLKGVKKPGQLDGHAVCIVDDTTLIDFGLGNVRRFYRRDFCWGIAQDLAVADNRLATCALSPRESLVWYKDWVPPEAEGELKQCEQVADQMMIDYRLFFG